MLQIIRYTYVAKLIKRKIDIIYLEIDSRRQIKYQITKDRDRQKDSQRSVDRKIVRDQQIERQLEIDWITVNDRQEENVTYIQIYVAK